MTTLVCVFIGCGLALVGSIACLLVMLCPESRSLLCQSCKRFTGVLFHIDGKQLCADCMKKDAEARHG
jgi:hypothetical protein